ncbi:MAG: DUF1854 domain-containing protein [Eubacteriales bacterium]|nr:DUF1854 domain-containing protein [Eubacteriales bacterium]
MIGFFISGDEVRIKKTGETTVSLEMYDGRRFENLEPMRLFPVSGITKYISLTDETGKEIAIIRDLDRLMPDSAEAIRACLASYYIVPKIKKILSRVEKYGNITWTVETDRGNHSFSILNTSIDIKTLYDGRILIRDSNDNRYEIEDVHKLDKESLGFLKFDM